MSTIKVRLVFPGETASRPITSYLIQDYNLIFNILQARIEPGRPGELVMELEGEEVDLQNGLRFLEREGIGVAVLSRSIQWDSESCVSCGACTAVCASGALHLDADAKLSFDQEKCVVCQMCIKSCPMGVLHLSYGE